ncbi:MAG: nitric oxide reductase activation protein NorD [Eubacteriales bacterium]|nr:nitric oxide reductase activation protein NorD [Eubacteriales bacterium]
MNANQKTLKKMIREQELSITDEELFLSSAFQKHQTSLAQTATGRYRNGLQVLMEWDDDPEAYVAYTDNYKIHNNTANHLTQSFPTRYLRSQSLTGLTGHEIGHLRYTDFTSLGIYLSSMQNGSFYPNPPDFSTSSYQNFLMTAWEAMEDKEKATCMVLANCASSISNILEDVYIEARMCEAFPGVFRQGILLNNLRFAEQMPSIQEQIDKKYNDFSIVANLIIQYCKTGNINNLSGYSGPYLDYLEECVPYIDDSVYEDDAKARFDATNHILIILWEYLQPMIEEMKEKLEESDESEAGKNLSDTLGEEIKGGMPLPGIPGGKAPKNVPAGKKDKKNNPLPPDPLATRQAAIQEIQEVMHEEGERIALAKTNTITDENNPGITYNHQYSGSGYEKAASDLFDILTDVATEKAEERYQQEMTEELQKTANDIRYGNAHAGIHVTVNRIQRVEPSMISDYQSVAPALLRASKRLQASIAPLLREEAEGGNLKNLIYGKRLNMNALYHQDGTLFMRNRLPDEEQKLAVALLVDESGSMSWNDRITHARKTAIVLYDFCRGLNLPITIYGHSTDDGGVALYSYAEFDSIDNTDCYRLMDMSARGGNRDGAALRYVAEHLDKHAAKRKLLILISDGQPADYGYSGTEAEADLRGIKKEYEKKGITLFAAAIGDDKENIKRIYKDGFLDITNLEDLPKHMTLLVKQYLK